MPPDARAFGVGEALGLFLEAIDVSSSCPVRRSDPTSQAHSDCQNIRVEPNVRRPAHAMAGVHSNAGVTLPYLTRSQAQERVPR